MTIPLLFADGSAVVTYGAVRVANPAPIGSTPEAADPTVRAILRVFANRPWCRITRYALADRLEEIGSSKGAWLRCEDWHAIPVHMQNLPRRRRRRSLKRWRRYLIDAFGRWDW